MTKIFLELYFKRNKTVIIMRTKTDSDKGRKRKIEELNKIAFQRRRWVDFLGGVSMDLAPNR